MKNEIVKSFGESLKMDCEEILTDSLEETMDCFLDCEVLEAIPFFKVIKAICRGVIGIRECHLMKNTACFIQELKKHNCDKNRIEKYIKKLKSKKTFDAELERVMIILDKETENEKAQYLGRLFAALLNQTIEIKIFSDYAEILERVHLSDIKVVQHYWDKIDDEGLILVDKEDIRNFNRLSSQGIGEVIFVHSKKNKDKPFESQYFGFDNYSQQFICIITDRNYNSNKEIVFQNLAKTFMEGLDLEADEKGALTWTI